MKITKKHEFIFIVLSTIAMSLGVLFLIFTVEELIKRNLFEASFFFISFIVSIAMSYVFSEHPEAVNEMMIGLHEAFYGIILGFFESVNRKIGSKLSVQSMEKETSEHVHLLSRVFKWIVLPASILYVCVDFCYFRENALDSMLWGLLIFFYSNFLPDLPSIYRGKKNDIGAKDLPCYKKYALLLFAPLFIWALFSGVRLKWKTAENFHNFKSLTIYGFFLLLLSLFAFGDLPISIGDISEIFSLPFYGLMGYLTHLKVDKIW